MKKTRKVLLTALAVYVILLMLLLAAESKRPDASIRSFGDALWFSLVTMTTVGYGDLTPVTPLGRLLGLVFALCSVGILAALVALLLRMINGELLPLLRLRLSRDKTWYVFAEGNEASRTLADALRQQEQDALLIFPADVHDVPGKAVCLDRSCERLARLRGGRDGIVFFYLDASPWDNRVRALETARQGYPSYCMAELPADETPETLHFFEACAFDQRISCRAEDSISLFLLRRGLCPVSPRTGKLTDRRRGHRSSDLPQRFIRPGK